jgi:hypothetical protein
MLPKVQSCKVVGLHDGQYDADVVLGFGTVRFCLSMPHVTTKLLMREIYIKRSVFGDN